MYPFLVLFVVECLFVSLFVLFVCFVCLLFVVLMFVRLSFAIFCGCLLVRCVLDPLPLPIVCVRFDVCDVLLFACLLFVVVLCALCACCLCCYCLLFVC